MTRQSAISPYLSLNHSLASAELAGSLMCVNSMKLLICARDDDGIHLTKSGAFCRKFVTWAAEDFRWPGYEMDDLYAVNKVLNEPDFPPLAIMHDLLVAARIIRHHKGEAVLTKIGRGLIDDHGGLQAVLFDAFFLKLDPSAYDRFPIEYDDADLLHFLAVIHNRLGDWVRLDELAGWCLPIDLIRRHQTSPMADACYYLLSRLIRPLLWLGLIEPVPNEMRTPIESRHFRKTPLCESFLHFQFPKPSGSVMH